MHPLQENPARDPKRKKEEPAPSAAAWLRNPHAVEKRKTTAQCIAELAADPEWTGPPWEGDE